MEIIHLYESFSSSLKKQLFQIEQYFYTNPKVIKKFHSFSRKFPNVNKQLLFHLFLVQYLTPRELFHKQLFPILTCYDKNEKKPNIRLLDVLKYGKHACVLVGEVQEKNTTRQVIVKWYQSNSTDIEYEVNIYKRLDSMGCPLLRFTSSYKFWNSPVLVLEKLEPLTFNDDKYEMGKQIIYQLTFLHQFGVHCDIKPQNIMKRTGKKLEYFLIDFGGVATEPLDYGFKRWLWSPKWSSQKPHEEDQITTPVYDLVELGYTMKCLQNWVLSQGKNDGECRSGFKGRLRKYMEYVGKLLENPRIFPSRDDYKNLLYILSGKNVENFRLNSCENS